MQFNQLNIKIKYLIKYLLIIIIIYKLFIVNLDKIYLLLLFIGWLIIDLADLKYFKDDNQRPKGGLKKLRQAVEQSKSIIVITDEQGKIEYVNPRFTEITGYTLQEVTGESPRILKSGYLSEEEYKRLWATINSGQEWQGQFYNQTKENNYYWEQASISPVTNNRGEITNFIKVAKDVTKRKEQQKKLQANLEKATQIHRNLLPQEFPQQEDLQLAGFYQPAEDLGGDFYNFYHLDSKLVFYLADVSGHGLDGAMVNILIRENMNNYISASKVDDFSFSLQPKKMIDWIYDLYTKEEFSADYFLCIQIGCLDFNNWQINYSNAGSHILPFRISAAGEVDSVVVRGLPISNAISRLQNKLEEESFVLNPGEKLFLATDGLVEAENQGVMYGSKRLEQVIRENYYLDCELLKEVILIDFKEFMGRINSQDDITFLLAAREPQEKLTFALASDLSSLEAVEKEITSFLSPQLTDQELIILGFHELAVNAIEHGNQFADDKRVRIKAVVTDTYLRFTIIDEGSGFNWQKYLSDEISYQGLNERGRGLGMAYRIFDELTYNRCGNRVNAVKFLEEGRKKDEKNI